MLTRYPAEKLDPPQVRSFCHPEALNGKKVRFERPHQGLGGALIQPANNQAADGPVMRRERFGGLLNYYYRKAA